MNIETSKETSWHMRLKTFIGDYSVDIILLSTGIGILTVICIFGFSEALIPLLSVRPELLLIYICIMLPLLNILFVCTVLFLWAFYLDYKDYKYEE